MRISVPQMADKDSLQDRIEESMEQKRMPGRVSGRLERRSKPRVNEPFTARIWGIDSGDLPFNIDGVLDNISSTGLYLRVPRQMHVASEVRLIVHFLNGPTTGSTATVYGEILRDDPQPDGRHGIAVAIKRHKFL
jgi:hypothetical protein